MVRGVREFLLGSHQVVVVSFPRDTAYARPVAMVRGLAAAAAVLLVVVYAVGSGRWVATASSWYQSLSQPPWQPPPPVFGLAWSYNFLVLAIVGVVISLQAHVSTVAWFLGLFALSIVFALAWAWLFYGAHDFTASAVALTACAVITIPMVVLAWREQWWLWALLLPYQGWLLVASSLSWGYRSLN